ncbi:F-box domain [Arabidopsis suecica]|uniref:F-box domain n=1 Tax=Arabidopsis suecica TaxID=45249 RepID=A0A8T1YM99_ARASU|nr:F-box domain [Arabidopsis suecica]
MDKKSSEAENVQRIVGETMISDLPDDLLVKILLLVPTKDAVATMILSKRWLSIWTMMPKLNYKDNKKDSECKSVLQFIHKSLKIHKAPVLESISVHLGRQCPVDEDVGKWITNVIDRKVCELFFTLNWSSKPIKLPDSLYTCHTLVHLRLSRKILVELVSQSYLPSLTRLDLKCVFFKDEDSLVRLLSGCHILRDLYVKRHIEDNVKNFKVKVSSLKFLVYEYDKNKNIEDIRGSLVIDSPALNKIIVYDNSRDSCTIENTPHLDKASIIVMCYPGQFYSEPPAQGTVHAIVNGIWSRFHRDISVTKMEGNAFLFRVPNSSTRNRILSQGLWQIEGQTMFVAKWKPGSIPQKPELSSAPVWLELRNVPLQFFNEDGFEFIAGLVGEPKGLHPSTANMTNLEVAKVFTLIDPRKPLPEAVNVQFPSGEISRVLVSSPWMPPICSFCKEVGHILKRCKLAPVSCSACKSTCHSAAACPRAKAKPKKKVPRPKKSATPPELLLNLPATSALPAPSVKGKEIVIGSVLPSPKPALACNVASTSEWIQVKPKSVSKKGISIPASSPTPVQEGTICIDIGLDKIQADQDLLEAKSLESDSSDVLSSEDGVDPEIDESQFLKMFSQRQQRGFKDWFLLNRPIFGSLIETHVQQCKQKKLLSAILPGWSFKDNYAFSDLGKIWIMWHPSVKVSIISKSLQMMTCEVLLPDSQSEIVISFVYAANEESARRELWTEIVSIASSPRMVGKAWSVLGDFNQVLSPSDNSSSLNPNVDLPIRLFRDCLLEADLSDLNFRGCSFTWWNKRSANPLAKKLDRILVNENWLQLFPASLGFFGEPDFSDHSSCSITLNPFVQRQRKAFRFQNFLLQNPNFVPLVAYHWFSFNLVGSAMLRFSKKLKILKRYIREFSKDNYSNLEKRVKEAHLVVLRLQQQLLSNPTPALALLEMKANEKWQVLLQAEESFLCQRSRITWLREGDLNTAYFHRITSARLAMNHIHFLVDNSGGRIESQQLIQEHCVSYYKSLLGGPEESPQFDPADLSSLLEFRCSPAHQAALDSVFSPEEIRQAVFSLPRNKTSGPDGYSAEFFKSCWHIVGPELVEAVSEFFRSGQLLKQWNATTIILIPKIPNASSTSDFRPISLCNTVYKVISKLLAGRLQSLLPSVISNAQSAFLPGRLLAENVLLATELVNGYSRKNIGPRGMLKVDLRKAFDSVKWEFITAILKAMHFPDRFINWISQCISTPQFSVSVNGVTSGYFQSSRGLRQGDPISPYLFVLAMEVFSKLMSSSFAAGFINHHPQTKELDITHLMFADDVMVFFDGSSSSLTGISDALDIFASWSGLKMNCEKTQIFTAGLDPGESLAISSFGFPIGSMPIRYLGLPLMSRKLRISEYSPLIEKLRKRFQSWATSSLSYARRLQLIKSVIYGLINFWTSTFILPKACIKLMESLCARFLWSGSVDISKGFKVSWANICYPKTEGGLGLRRLGIWNSTLCLKLVWLLFSGSGSLWVAWHHHHHIKGKSFWSLNPSTKDSWNWRSLLNLRPLAERFVQCKLGNGRLASFWFDSWCPLGPLIKYFGVDGPSLLRLPIHCSVADAWDDNGWILPPSRSLRALPLIDLLDSVTPVFSSLEEDSYFWVIQGIKFNRFPTAITWESTRPRTTTKDWATSVWFKGATPKHAFTMWTAQLQRLPTRARLASWGLPIPSTCCLCSIHEETHEHLLLRCAFSEQVWHLIQLRLCLPPCLFYTWPSLISWTKMSTSSSPSILRKLASHAAVYHLWKQRNNALHNQIYISPDAVFILIDKELRNTISARRNRKHFRNLMALWIR